MNLNTSNPLLMAAITGGGGFAVSANSTGGPLDVTSPFGLFSRSRNLGLYRGLVSSASADDGTGDDESTGVVEYRTIGWEHMAHDGHMPVVICTDLAAYLCCRRGS